jgi:predicted translin family RNA/ssDNA-binding protein
MRLKTAQLLISVVLGTVTIFTMMLGAVAFFARPYLNGVIHDETNGLKQQIEAMPSVYHTRREYEDDRLELERKLDMIANGIDRIDQRILTQSDRTDTLFQDLARRTRN